MLTDIDLNNFISFGVLSDDSQADITLTVNDGTVLNRCEKGVPIQSVPLSQICGFVQNVCKPELLTIYYKNTNLPQHLNAINGRTCVIIVNALNGLLRNREVFITNWYFSVYKDGCGEKQGRRMWSNRYLMIVGCRLLVFRHPVSKCRGSTNFPLNVIDLTNALISQKSETVISISTHRIYEFRFSDSATVSSWLMELKGAASRGMSLVSDLVVVMTSSNDKKESNPIDFISTPRHSLPSILVNPDSIESSSDEELPSPSLTNPSHLYNASPTKMDPTLSMTSSRLQQESTLYAWGINTSGQVSTQCGDSCVYQPMALSLVSPRWIAAGSSHVVCVSSSGTVFTWGDNQKGQLGSMSGLTGEVPYPILSISLPCRSVSCGGNHSGLVDGEGGVWMWGNGIYGQLGMGLECEHCSQPTLLQKVCHRDIQKIACGQSHSLFLSSSGCVYACGNGYYGQLGLVHSVDYFSPIIIQSLLNHTIIDIAAGESFSLFLTDQHTVLSTGQLEIHEDSNMPMNEEYLSPHPLALENVEKIAAGSRFAVFLTSSRGKREVYWMKAQPEDTKPACPVLIPSLTAHHITDIVCGISHCIAFSTITGRAFAWGTNYCGELGDSTNTPRFEPIEIEMNEDETFIQMDAGNCFTIGLAVHADSQATLDSRKDVVQENSIENESGDGSQALRFNFNTLETAGIRERPRVVNSELTRSMLTSTISTKQSIPFTPLVERKSPMKEENKGENDICFASRAARAAALEKQFQQFRK